MKQILLFLLFFQCISIFSQDWQIFHSGRTRFYDKGTKALRVDSTFYQNGDSILKFYNCLTSTRMSPDSAGSTFFGKELIIKPNGDQYLYFKDIDTLFFPQNIQINDTWSFTFRDSMAFGKLMQIDTVHAFDYVDSIRVIQIHLGANDSVLIKISKSNGLNSTEFYLNQEYNQIDITNPFVTSPDIRPTIGEIYDMKRGDKFGFIGGNEFKRYRLVQTVKNVTYSGDSIQITLQVVGRDTVDPHPGYPGYSSFICDCKTYTIKNLSESLFFSLPYEYPLKINESIIDLIPSYMWYGNSSTLVITNDSFPIFSYFEAGGGVEPRQLEYRFSPYKGGYEHSYNEHPSTYRNSELIFSQQSVGNFGTPFSFLITCGDCGPQNGSLFNDINQNCFKEPAEPLINGNLMLTIQPGNIQVMSHNGIYYIDSLVAGTYTITVDTTLEWKATCSPTATFTMVHPDSFVQIPSIGLKNINSCTKPDISIYAPTLRRCFTNQIVYIDAKNLFTATQILYNSYAEVKLDSFLTIDSSTLPYTYLGNYIYRFELDSLYPGQSKTWQISTTVSCSTILGQTLCMQANLYPVASCVLDTIPNIVTGVSSCLGPWDNSSLGVKGECVGDSIRFVINNNGVFGNGDMDCFMPFRLYVDGALTTLDSLKIVGGDSLVITFLSDGKTWRLEADQHPLHPGNSHPNASVEACGDSALVSTNWTPNLITSMSQDDADLVVDIYCGQVMGSFDPNDKTGYPLGILEEHYILPNQQLQYVIRFQNTGTDTVFKVVIRDTLETDLNITSVVSGVSSHNYSFNMYPRILEWTFNDILLPDSFVNESKSHGFVTFTVEQNPNLSDGTKIENSAAIYFDLNSPIITNTSIHTVDFNTNKLNVSIDKSQKNDDIKVYPNPNNGLFKVELPMPFCCLSGVEGKLTICNVMGQVVHVETLHATSLHEIDLSKQPNGIYFLKVEMEGMEWNKKVVKN